MGRTSGVVRMLHVTRCRNLQGPRRSRELASLLRDWNNGGEINEKRDRKPTCYRCHDKGHFAWGCPRKGIHLSEKKIVQDKIEPVSKPDDQSDRTFDPLQPYTQTHVERTLINGDYLVEGTNTGSWNSIWYVNSKISKHMTPSKDIFVKFKKCFSINCEEHLLNPLYTHGVGEINLTTDVNIYGVPYVSYVPEININVLSMKQLILQGFEIEVNGSKCKITHMCDDRKDVRDVQNKTVERDIRILAENHPELKKTHEHEASSSKINDKLEIDGKTATLNIKSLDDFTSFMVLTNCDRIVYKDKGLFMRKFDEALVWFHKIKSGEEITLPPKLAGLDICLFDVYKLIAVSGGHDKITREGEWSEMAMSFGYPECYGKAFKELFDQYLLTPQEYYEFELKSFGRSSSVEGQIVGGVTNRVFAGKVTSEGGLAGGPDQDDRNFVCTRRSNQVQTQDSDEEDPSIEGYHSVGK